MNKNTMRVRLASGCGALVIAVSAALASLLVWNLVLVSRKSHNLGDILLCSFYLFDDDGEYAPGYSDKAFMEIRVGDSMSMVLEKLGPPLAISWMTTDGNWHTSKSGDSDWAEQAAQMRERVAEYPIVELPTNQTVEFWDYSRAGPDQNYWFRSFSFDSEAKILYKDGHYFGD